MLNLLIVDDNLHFSKILINIISQCSNNFKLCTLATNGKEALEQLKNNSFDIILLDLRLPKVSGITILKELEKNYKKKYEKSIIVVSCDENKINLVKNSKCIFSIVNKIYGIDIILENILNLAKFKQDKKENELLKVKIIDELQKINYNISYVGTRYIADIINIIIEKNKTTDFNLKKDIIPILCKKYNKTPSNIKMNVKHATENMFFDCKQEVLNNYFGFNIIEKPKPKMVITTIINKLINMGIA